MHKDIYIKEEACNILLLLRKMNPATGVENCTMGFEKMKTPKMSIDGKKTPMNEGSQLSITKETMMIEPEKNGLCSRYSVVMDAI